MTDEELAEFLKNSRWTDEMRRTLIEEWNARRGKQLARIGMNNVRTPCRLREILGSFKAFLETNKVVT